MKAGQDCQDFFKKSENGCGQESSGGEWKEVASIDGEPNVSWWLWSCLIISRKRPHHAGSLVQSVADAGEETVFN